MGSSARVMGTVTVQLEDKATGRILQQETKQNTITDAFLQYMLAKATQDAPLSQVLLGASKSASGGQYMAAVSSQQWGIYCMSSVKPVNADTRFPAYVEGITDLATDVSFYNVNGNSGETPACCVPAPGHSTYSRIDGDNSLTIEYQKDSGSGVVRSIHFGRAHTYPQAIVGQILGEPSPPQYWTSGMTPFIAENQVGTTKIWKTNGTSTAYDMDFVSKACSQRTGNAVLSNPAYNASTFNTMLTTNTTASNLNGGIVVDNVIFRCMYQSTVAGTSVTVRLYRSAITNAASVTYQDIVFPISAGKTYNPEFRPVIVARPDNNTVEIFLATSSGDYTANSVTKYGAHVQKAVCTNLRQTSASAIAYAVSDVGTLNFVPSVTEAMGVPTTNLPTLNIGLYDVATGNYWMPCSMYASPVDGTAQSLANANFCPGYVFDSNWDVVDDYFAYSTDAGGFLLPCKTDVGVLPVAVNTSTLYYPKISQVISGVVLDAPFNKTSDKLLRIIYKYSLT